MKTRTLGVPLAVVACLLWTAPAAAQRPQVDSRCTSLVLTEGIQGGIIGPIVRYRVAVSYDWNRGVHRVFVRDADGCWRAELAPEAFDELVELVLELGLPRLPLEDPPGCQDLYRMDTGIAFAHEGRVWHNRAPYGCSSGGSRVHPSPEELDDFRAVVIAVRAFAEGLEYEPASRLDEAVAAPGEPAPCGPRTRGARGSPEGRQLAWAFPAAVEHLRRSGLAPELDLNRVTSADGELRFAFRAVQHGGDLPARFWPGFVGVRVTPEGAVEHRVVPLPWPRDPEATDRRRRFVEAHPELTRAQSELILAGWVQHGMSLEMVLAARGEPDECRIGHVGASLRYPGRLQLAQSNPAAASALANLFAFEFGDGGLWAPW